MTKGEQYNTSYCNLTGILAARMIYPSFSGCLGPGAYVTKIKLDPKTLADTIARLLHMKIENVETYIDLKIDINRIILASDPLICPDEWVYPNYGIPLPGHPANKGKVIIEGIGEIVCDITPPPLP